MIIEYKILLISLLSYFFSSIPFSLILPKLFYKVDVRKVGSGNIGATNVYRACGIKMAVICFLCDGLKSLLTIMIARFCFDIAKSYLYIIAIATVFGHVYSVFLKFNGGKGVATSIFAILSIDPLFAVLFGILWGVIFYLKKISSLSAILSFFIIMLLSIISSVYNILWNVSYQSHFYIFLFVFICFTHRQNIIRIINGTEGKIKK